MARKLRGGLINGRTIAAPVAAATMACLLYAYAVSSIRAAKRNAKLHREADGGQLDMRKESLRIHGMRDKVEGTGGYALFRDSTLEGGSGGSTATNNTKLKGSKTQAQSKTSDDDVPIELSKGDMIRTQTEGKLEEYKRKGNFNE